jgi:hypothetical protein
MAVLHVFSSFVYPCAFIPGFATHCLQGTSKAANSSYPDISTMYQPMLDKIEVGKNSLATQQQHYLSGKALLDG